VKKPQTSGLVNHPGREPKRRAGMDQNKISVTDIFSLTIYAFINALFVYKYTARITSLPWATSLLYLVLLGLFVLLLYRMIELRLTPATENLIYYGLILIFAVVLTLVMFQFDPAIIRVGRYPAIHEWITRFLNSEFPYASHTRPSGFPFLFVLAMPFHFLGDIGYFQIFSFSVLGILIHLRYGPGGMNRFRCIFLLMAAPIFLYEIVVRSDLFSNMIMVMLYLAMVEMVGERASRIGLILLGIMGGLLLSTRGIVLLIYIPFFGYLFRRKIIRDGWFLLSMLLGFSLSLAPFLVWDWTNFTNFGPFSIQLSHIPNWALILAIAGSLCCALTVESLKRIYSSVGFILFGVTFMVFIISVIDFGWYPAVLGDRFDISYFCFALPFLLISLDFSEKRISQFDGMFANGSGE
jgi:hypothetical protein